jgi:hypothetical protein
MAKAAALRCAYRQDEIAVRAAAYIPTMWNDRTGAGSQ